MELKAMTWGVGGYLVKVRIRSMELKEKDVESG